MTNRLEEPILDNGTRFVNFFEGRILTGRDLSDEQAAARRQQLRLGRALGPGIVRGLEVTLDTVGGSATAPVLAVAPGLAIGCEGEALEVGTTMRIEVVRALSLAAGGRKDIFGACINQAPGSQLPAGVGVYLLTIAPASGFEEEAPKAGMGANGVADGCGRRYATLGVKFRLVQIDPTAVGGSPSVAAEIATLLGQTATTAVSRLRNLLAHAFLGTEDTAGFAIDPFASISGLSPWASYGLLDDLGAGTTPVLTACEVPLAAVYWTLAGVGFLDPWSVRRRRGLPPIDAAWPLIHSDRRAGEAEAMLQQFQAQLSGLQTALSGSGGPVAIRDFRFLPAAGLLPIGDASAFLTGLSVDGPIDIERARFLAVLEEGRSYPALDLAQSPPPAIRLYRVGGATSWLLYSDVRIPSPEIVEARLAALETRVADLEAAISAPGTIFGLVQFEFNFGFGRQIFPLPNVVVTATDEDGTATTATTVADGSYSLSVPPGTYSLQLPNLPVRGGIVITPASTREENFTYSTIIGIVDD